MSSLFSQLQTFFWNIFNRPQLNDLLDILIVAVLIYQMIMLTRDTRASEVLKGFLLLVGASLLSSLLGLTALTWVLKQILSNGALVLVVLFQLRPAWLLSAFNAVLGALALFQPFNGVVGGMFSVSAIVYYLSVIALFLFLTGQSLERRRWH